MACFIWGKQWSGKVVQFWSDNEAVVVVLNKLSAKDKQLSALCYDGMAFLAAKYSFWQPTSREEITRQLIPFQEMTSRFYAQAPVCRNGQRAHENSSRPPLVDIQYVQPPDWLYITSLDGAVQEFYAARLVKSTRAVYRAGQKEVCTILF